MRKCRNWQTSKTKDLVIIAIVWVQVPSSALSNKTGTKQSVWSLSYCSKPKRALNPWFKARFGSVGSWHEVPRTSLAPSSAWLRLLRGRRPWVQGLRSASVVAEQTSPGRLATHLPHGYGRYGAGAPGFKIAYILDQKERSIL